MYFLVPLVAALVACTPGATDPTTSSTTTDGSATTTTTTTDASSTTTSTDATTTSTSTTSSTTTTTMAPTTTTTTLPPVPKSLGMKLLVISADGTETDLSSITAFLGQQGMPFDTLIASHTPLTAATLQDSPSHGLYEGIVLTTGDLTYESDPAHGTYSSAFTTAEWNILHAYQSAFGVRSVTSYTYPEAAYGLGYVGYRDTLGNPLTASLTTAGQSVFSNIKATAAIPLSGAWVYLGSVADPTVTTPLVTTTVNGQSYPVASVTKYAGYQNLAITVANNSYLTHSLLLAPGWIKWVTQGVGLGSRHANIDVQIDDLFLPDDIWNTTTKVASTPDYRNTAADINGLVAWQNARHLDPTTPDLKSEFAFVGSEVKTTGTDALRDAVVANKDQLGFINHTYDHYNLDCGDCPDPTGIITTTAAKIQSEITQNITRGLALGLPFNADEMVQPDISGINTPPNPMAQQASADAGIRYWIGDTSHEGQDNPSFNVGYYTAGDARLYVVPRRPSNLFFDVSTPAQWVDIYNYFYAPGGQLCGITTCFTQPQTYAQILDSESTYFLQFLLNGDDDPWMFHSPNVKLYDGIHSVMSDVLDATFAKYDALVNVPIRSLPFGQTGLNEQARGLYNASGVTATETPCVSIKLSTVNAATIPVTGVSYTAPNSTVETYAGQTISNVSLTAGQSVTIPLPAC
jgi:hypothetical protein